MLETQNPSEYFYEYTKEDLSAASFRRLVIRSLPATSSIDGNPCR
jgi:hypothetical protein